MQNIDSTEQQVSQLSAKSIQLYGQLYGRIDQLRCSHCGWFGLSDFQFFPITTELERKRIGKHPTQVGRLRPHVVLYGEDTENNRESGLVIRTRSMELAQWER